MNEWIKGPPTELGEYWAIVYDDDVPCPIEINDTWAEMKVAFLGDELFHDLDCIEWHMPLTPPKPPENRA